MKKIIILGSTGSIGRQTLEILRKDKKNFDVVDINKLGDYVARWVQGGETYTPETNQYRCSVNSLGDF